MVVLRCCFCHPCGTVRSLDEITPGLVLGGRYECLLPIARGGQASVWAARISGARGFEKTVAIKTMLPSLSKNSNFERMFLDEARVASRISHPNVVEILDLGEEGALLYLVMEYVEGEQLQFVIDALHKRPAMPVHLGVKIVMDVCAGLHAAHELKQDGRPLDLVHRDVSPQNIMLSVQGHVKLVDFGVAKMKGRLAEETADGFVRGKTSYLAPEQVVDASLDRRTDLFALGVILYEVTTGTHPFRAESDGATLHNILRKPVKKPSTLRADYPAGLEAVVLRALEREPEFRFQTASDMFRALDAVLPPQQRATAEDLASFVQPIIGSRVERFLADLSHAAQRTPVTQPLKAPSDAAVSPHRASPDAAISSEPRPEPSSAHGGTSLPAEPRDRSRRLPTTSLVAAAVFAIALVFVVLALRNELRRRPPLSNSLAPEIGATASAPPIEPATSAATPGPSAAMVEPLSAAPVDSSAQAAASASPANTSVARRVPSSAPNQPKRKPASGKKWTPPVSESGL